MRIHFITPCVLIAFGLTACAQALRSPTPTNTPVPPTDTPTPKPAKPSPTMIPTSTPTSHVSGGTATPDLAGMEVREWVSTSPDGVWEAAGLAALPTSPGGGDRYHSRLTVYEVNGDVQYEVMDEWTEFGLGYTTPQPFLWSTLGPFFYYTNKPVPDGCAIFVNGSDLYRVDLRDGAVRQVLPSAGLWLSLSPDESQLAYIGYGERGLVVRDLESGNERQASLDPGFAYQAGQIVWSPTNQEVVLTVANQPCSENWAESTSIVWVDLESMQVKTVITEDPHMFVTEGWSDSQGILLSDENGNLWWLDPATWQVQRE